MFKAKSPLSRLEDGIQNAIPHARARKRKKLFAIFLGCACFVALGGGSYWYFVSSNYASTDNAYVAADVAQVTSSVDGTIQNINVIDTQGVKTGDILVVIDDIDAQLELSRASGLFEKAKADLDRAEVDLNRRKKLSSSGSGSIAGEELSNAENAFRSAKAVYNTAKAAVDKADIDLKRTTVRSPVDGIVVKREVQLGQKVRAGMPLMSVVPMKNVYVNANFKENQLRKVKLGQSVELVADIYGSDVTYHGQVVGMSGGTGAAFSLIPAQNATGNWIKVVQRLPVRIALVQKELEQNPLQVGLSMTVKINTRTN